MKNICVIISSFGSNIGIICILIGFFEFFSKNFIQKKSKMSLFGFSVHSGAKLRYQINFHACGVRYYLRWRAVSVKTMKILIWHFLLKIKWSLENFFPAKELFFVCFISRIGVKMKFSVIRKNLQSIPWSTFPQKRFKDLWYSHRPSASMEVN